MVQTLRVTLEEGVSPGVGQDTGYSDSVNGNSQRRKSVNTQKVEGFCSDTRRYPVGYTGQGQGQGS